MVKPRQRRDKGGTDGGKSRKGKKGEELTSIPIDSTAETEDDGPG